MYRRRRLKPALSERAPLLELTFTVLLWQASVGIFLLSLLQKYLPEELGASAAFPGYAMASYGLAKFVCQTPSGWLADRIGRRLTLSLGAFLALLAVGAVGHALAIAVCRRRHELAVLRALGMTQRRARAVADVRA